jgi:hypothetical protein
VTPHRCGPVPPPCECSGLAYLSSGQRTVERQGQRGQARRRVDRPWLGMSRNGPGSQRSALCTPGRARGRIGATPARRVPAVLDDGRHTVRRRFGSQRTDGNSPPFRRCLLPIVESESAPASGSNDAPPTRSCAFTPNNASGRGHRASPTADETEPVRRGDRRSAGAASGARRRTTDRTVGADAPLRQATPSAARLGASTGGMLVRPERLCIRRRRAR